MMILLGVVLPGGDDCEQGLKPFHTESARGRYNGVPTQASCSNRNDALDPRIEPHNTDATQALFCRDPDEWECEAIERVPGVSHLYCIGWKCSELKRGIL